MTKIEWANRTWNPVTGCTRVSEGCDHCYMHRMYPRLKGFGTPGYSLEPDMIEQMPDRLGQPMLWKKPARIFVCSMSDFFHNEIPGSYRDRMFRAMTEAATERGHIFMVLTKRPAIALSWWNGHRPQNNKDDFWHPNIWLGTSVERQKYVSRIQAAQENAGAHHKVRVGGTADRRARHQTVADGRHRELGDRRRGVRPRGQTDARAMGKAPQGAMQSIGSALLPEATGRGQKQEGR